jgi:hypothetical protein
MITMGIIGGFVLIRRGVVGMRIRRRRMIIGGLGLSKGEKRG